MKGKNTDKRNRQEVLSNDRLLLPCLTRASGSARCSHENARSRPSHASNASNQCSIQRLRGHVSQCPPCSLRGFPEPSRAGLHSPIPGAAGVAAASPALHIGLLSFRLMKWSPTVNIWKRMTIYFSPSTMRTRGLSNQATRPTPPTAMPLLWTGVTHLGDPAAVCRGGSGIPHC